MELEWQPRRRRPLDPTVYCTRTVYSTLPLEKEGGVIHDTPLIMLIGFVVNRPAGHSVSLDRTVYEGSVWV